MRRATFIGVALTVLLVSAACGGTSPQAIRNPPPPSPATTTSAPAPLARWRAANITRYRFDFHPSCFCSYVDMRIEVKDGKVVRTTMLPPDEAVPVNVATAGQRPTIDSLLSDLGRAQTKATGPVHATYDPKYGVPTKASIDWIKNAMDDEIAWEITNFTPL